MSVPFPDWCMSVPFLQLCDQLTGAIGRGEAFVGFNEPKISFRSLSVSVCFCPGTKTLLLSVRSFQLPCLS